MKRLLVLAFCAWTAMSAVAAAGDELVVGFQNVAQPDAELDDFVQDLRLTIMSAKMRDYAAFNRFFAPRIDVFQRSLDPLQPWNPGEPITRSPLTSLADVLVEQEPIEGQPAPDYRDDVLRAILRMIWPNAPRGTMKQVPGAICAPAEYDFDRKAALAFARRFELDAYSLRFFAKDVILDRRPGSAAAGVRVPARTLMMFNLDPMAPEGWSYYETWGGKKGYMKDGPEVLGLTQNHICFSKVNGSYVITAVFGYGL